MMFENRSIHLLFTISILLLSVVSYGQSTYTISGKVLSEESPLYAFIYLANDDNVFAESDMDGQFVLEGVPQGQQIIIIESLGYKTDTIELDIDSDMSIGSITLLEEISNTEEIVITGTRRPVYVSKSPVKVEIVTSEHINNFKPTASTSLVEAMDLVNGVNEVVGCGICYTNSININGLPGQYTAVLIDGTPLYGNLSSVYGLNGIPSTIIDQIEIIKGPNSTLYGSNAMAGVINVITKSPDKAAPLTLSAYTNTHLDNSLSLTASPKIGKVKTVLGIDYTYANTFFDDNDDLFGDEVLVDQIGVFSKWLFPSKNTKKKHSLIGKYYFEDRRNGLEEYVKNRNYRDLRGNDSIYGESIYTHRAELFGTYHLPTKLDMRLDYTFSYHDQNSIYGDVSYIANQYLGFLSLIADKKIGSHFLTVGTTTQYESYDDNTVATEDKNGNKPTNDIIPSVFIQDEWEASERFTLLTGARVDHHQDNGFIFSPRLSTKLNIKDYTTIRANAGTGFKVVNLFTEDHAFATGQREIIIEEDLKPEQSYNATLSLRQVYGFEGINGSVELSGHYNYFTNKIIPDYSNPSEITYGNLDGHAISQGVGIEVMSRFTKIPLNIQLSYNRLETSEFDKGDDGSTEKRIIEFSPNWTALGTFSYQLKSLSDLLISYTINANGKTQLPVIFDTDTEGNLLDVPRPTVSDPFMLHNIQIKKTFQLKNNKGLKTITAYTGLDNIFNFRQSLPLISGFQDKTVPIGFGEHFDTAYAYAPINGRALYLGVDFKF